jgi:RNA polymerase sigma factor (sigma-70 family)
MYTHTVDTATAHCSNETLLTWAAEGDQWAWRRLIDRYDGLIRSVAGSFRLQPADVQDVTQTTWLRLLQNLHAIRDPERLAGWLAVTASRESLSILRKASQHSLVPLADEAPDPNPEADPERRVLDRDAAGDLWAAVAELPARQRSLLVALFREESSSYDEIAANCAMPIGSIGPTRARALSHLRRKLADRGLGAADL